MLSKSTDNNPLAFSDQKAICFVSAIVQRFGRIVGWSGHHAQVSSIETQYVIPGAMITLKDGDVSVPVWIGVNGGRIFYILRMKEPVEFCERAFRFAFGGAAKVGWSFLYEPLSDVETSVWGTAETKVDFVSGVKDGFLSLTSDGEFWVNDIAMMMQSALRTIQREHLAVSAAPPEPL